MKIALLLMLGLLWSVRLSAIKAAGLSQIPAPVVVAVSALGISVFFSGVATWRRCWPPVSRATVPFYVLSGALGFIFPFLLESFAAPHLTVFTFVVIIATMPILTLILAVLIKKERLTRRNVAPVCLGFVGAMLIVWDTAQGASSGANPLFWVLVAFGVPGLYALNTVFVATRWPASADALQVALAQALIVSCAVFLGGVAFDTLGDWSMAGRNIPAMLCIVVGEGLALLIYLEVARQHGAIYVSFANYISMAFAAVIGTLLFDDEMTWFSGVAAIAIIAAVIYHHSRDQAS